MLVGADRVAANGDAVNKIGTYKLAAVAKDNVFAIQFHPEKSQSAGKRLLDAYRAWLDQS